MEGGRPEASASAVGSLAGHTDDLAWSESGRPAIVDVNRIFKESGRALGDLSRLEQVNNFLLEA